jgi:hypothetical protein
LKDIGEREELASGRKSSLAPQRLPMRHLHLRPDTKIHATAHRPPAARPPPQVAVEFLTISSSISSASLAAAAPSADTCPLDEHDHRHPSRRPRPSPRPFGFFDLTTSSASTPNAKLQLVLYVSILRRRDAGQPRNWRFLSLQQFYNSAPVLGQRVDMLIFAGLK